MRAKKDAAARALAGLLESVPHTGEKKALIGGARVAVTVREGRRSGPGRKEKVGRRRSAGPRGEKKKRKGRG